MAEINSLFFSAIATFKLSIVNQFSDTLLDAMKILFAAPRFSPPLFLKFRLRFEHFIEIINQKLFLHRSH